MNILKGTTQRDKTNCTYSVGVPDYKNVKKNSKVSVSKVRLYLFSACYLNVYLNVTWKCLIYLFSTVTCKKQSNFALIGDLSIFYVMGLSLCAISNNLQLSLSNCQALERIERPMTYTIDKSSISTKLNHFFAGYAEEQINQTSPRGKH